MLFSRKRTQTKQTKEQNDYSIPTLLSQTTARKQNICGDYPNLSSHEEERRRKYVKRSQYIFVYNNVKGFVLRKKTFILLIGIIYLIIDYYVFRWIAFILWGITTGIDDLLKIYIKNRNENMMKKTYNLEELGSSVDNFERYIELEQESKRVLSFLCVSMKEKEMELINFETFLPLPNYIIQAPVDFYQAVTDSFVNNNALGKYSEQGWKQIHFTDAHMKRILRDAIPSKPLIPFYSALSISQQKILFSIVAIYSYGGLFLSDQITLNLIDYDALKQIFHNGYNKSKKCFPNKAIFIKSSNQNSADLSFFISTPRHPLFMEILNAIPSKNFKQFLKIEFHDDFFYDLLQKKLNANDSSIHFLSQLCSKQCEALSCCNVTNTKDEKIIFEYTTTTFQRQNSQIISTTKMHNSDYNVKEQKVAKKYRMQTLKEKKCVTTWPCNRCLRYAGLGTYKKCSFTCSKCFMDYMCQRQEQVISNEIMINVPIEAKTNEGFIPKIIHQTWFETLTPEKYPNMIRLQNSWRATGWEYRFYDDEAVRTFITTNFPFQVLEAYDSLIPGAYKADFFRYLVLLVSGGVYADIDLMLETTIETLITPEISFMTARDTPGQEGGEPFCLWNGFIASQPGHPFLQEAVERSLNLIRQRATLLDMEKDICSKKKDSLSCQETPIWKIRSEQGLLLTGPCALGISVNQVIGDSDALAKFSLGLMKHKKKDNYFINGVSHILLLRKDDLGAIRLTDVERNVIVATTEIPGMSKFPSVELQPSTLTQNGNNREKKHYSYSGKGDWEWGSEMVYVDDQVTKNNVKVFIQFHGEK